MRKIIVSAAAFCIHEKNRGRIASVSKEYRSRCFYFRVINFDTALSYFFAKLVNGEV